jgi:hypothetical protein
MTDLESQQLIAYRNIAFEIISKAVEELEDGPNFATSSFIDAPWFFVLCQVAGGNPDAVRKIAHRLPGYIGKTSDNNQMFTRSALDPRLVPLLVTNREGKQFTVYGYMRAAALMNCSHQAVSLAVKEGRGCHGWEIRRIKEGAIA